MSRIIIGTANGKNIGFPIDELLVSRLLVQANSGGGKSFLLRRILEQAYGKVQAIVIDPAGEFATLREKFGYVLVGEHGETPADIRSAGLVAEKLLELKASAVCDLYSVKPADRHEWVKRFLTAVMNAPKRLWHPVLFVIDEAHKFVPEKGEGESVAKEMMLSLASDGRKYGFCAIFATQRLAKLDKSAASELLNVLIGPTFMDIDLARAHKALGILPRDQAAFNEQMKTIRPGHFWALGRAISKTRVLVKVGTIETTHPKAGYHHSAEPPPAPEKIKALLPKLADLPKEAEDKARTEAEFKREIRELKIKLSAAGLHPSKPAAFSVSKADPKQARTIQQLRAALQEAVKMMTKVASFNLQVATVDRTQVEVAVKSLVDRIIALSAQSSSVQQKQFEQLRREAKPMIDKLQRMLETPPPQPAASAPVQPAASRTTALPAPSPIRPAITPNDRETSSLGPTNRKIAAILAAYYPEAVDKDLLASMCGKTLGGGWNARLSETRQAGLLEDVEGKLRATDECVRQYGGKWTAPTSTEEAIAVWNFKLSETHRSILNRLIEADGEPVAKADLAAAAGKSPGGGFNARLSELRSTGLMLDAGRGFFKANKRALFLNGEAA